MLQKLYVQNYALIDQLEMNLSSQMTIITGETGAGKSIILGALSLILGNRVPSNAMYKKDSKCIVEGTFNIEHNQLQAFFEENELDYDHETIIRREISPSGKSRAFVNDTPVHLSILKKLTEQLVNLHAQHQTLHLFDAQYHLFIIDTLADHFDLLKSYQEDYKTYRSNCRKLKKLQTTQAQIQKDLDYILFQLKEFEEAALFDPNEQEALEQEQLQLTNAESIKQKLLEGAYIYSGQEQSVAEQLNVIQKSLLDLSAFNPAYEKLADRLNSCLLELQDITDEMERLEEEVIADPERSLVVSERLNLIFRLQQKHQVNSLGELMDIEKDLADKSQSAGNLESEMAELTKTIDKQYQLLLKKASKISKNRLQQLPVFEGNIIQLLAKVGMPHAVVKAAHQRLKEGELGEFGIDQIELLFAANKGMPPAELRKVASGGELSRLMLCIQSLIADNTALPTLIFDEIDTGISGEVARKVGIVMQQLAQAHQVICITHLPQIASMGEKHYFVYKQHEKERSITCIKSLSSKERVVEIAKMLSGDQPGQMALANAKELLTHTS